MQNFWFGLEISKMKKISKLLREFDELEKKYDRYFTIEMKDEHLHTFHYSDSQYAGAQRFKVKSLYNEYNDIPDTYLIESDSVCLINGQHFNYGNRVIDNFDNYIDKTNLEIEELKKQGKIVDEGRRSSDYVCPIRIFENKMFYGEINDISLAQLKALGFNFNFKHGKYSFGKLRRTITLDSIKS